MRMRSLKEYRKLTGKNLLNKASMEEIYGDGKELEFNAELFIAFVYSLLIDGAYPGKFELTIDDVAGSLKANDSALARNLMIVYVSDVTGKTIEEADEALEKAKESEKNLPALTEGLTK